MDTTHTAESEYSEPLLSEWSEKHRRVEKRASWLRLCVRTCCIITLCGGSFLLGRVTVGAITEVPLLKSDRVFPPIPMREVTWTEDPRFSEVDPMSSRFWSKQRDTPWSVWDEIHRGSWIQLTVSAELDIVGGFPLVSTNGTWPNGKQGFVPAVLHQLHCIGGLTHILQKSRKGETISVHDHEHMGHCIEYLRHAVMCYGDTTLERPVDKSRPMTTGFGTTHICRDWSTLSNFLWGVSVGFEKTQTGSVAYENLDAGRGNPQGSIWHYT